MFLSGGLSPTSIPLRSQDLPKTRNPGQNSDAKTQYLGGRRRYRLPRRHLEIITYTSRCDVRKAKPHLQLVVGRDTRSNKKSFHHYTGSGSHLWTNQIVGYVIYPSFSMASTLSPSTFS